MLNWDHIRYFIAVADHGSVSRAARSLGVSHATILRAIARLEEALQIRLFDHARTGYKLTDDGVVMLRHARGMEGEFQQLQIQARARDAVPAGKLNLAVPDQSLFDYMPLLHRFTMNHPNIAIVLKQANVLEPDDFLRQEVDVLLLVSNDAPETMVGRQLGKLRFGVYSCHGMENTENDEGQWIHWTLPGGSATGTMNQQQIHIQRLLGSPVRQVLDAGNHDRAVGAIRAGMGMGLIAENGATPEMDKVPVTGNLPEWGLWCLTHPDFRHAARVHAFMRFLADTLCVGSGQA